MEMLEELVERLSQTNKCKSQPDHRYSHGRHPDFQTVRRTLRCA